MLLLLLVMYCHFRAMLIWEWNQYEFVLSTQVSLFLSQSQNKLERTKRITNYVTHKVM